MGEPAAILLGQGTRRAECQTVYGNLRLWLRVHGTERSAGHHTADRQNLPHTYSGTGSVSESFVICLLINLGIKTVVHNFDSQNKDKM